MLEMMTFPDTWEEFEEQYGITDRKQIYTNGARLIPSFRVKQWLDHIADRKTEQSADCVKDGEDYLRGYQDGYYARGILDKAGVEIHIDKPRGFTLKTDTDCSWK